MQDESLTNPPPMALSADQLVELLRLVRNGRKIPAIKFIRDNLGMCLRDAKDFVEINFFHRA